MNGPTTPQEGRILAIDYGTVRLGFAISDPSQTFASPLENYTRINSERDAEHLRQVVAREEPAFIVVGLPIHLDGRESQKSQEARRFADWVTEVSGLPVKLFDERLSSSQAKQQLQSLSPKKRKQRIDMLAAQILLAGYLESDRTTETRDGLW